MASDGSIVLSTEVDTGGIDAGMSKIKSAAGTVGKVFAATGAAVSAGFTAAKSIIVASAVSSFAEFEQLKGGVETLFKDSASSLISYADQAYSTAGMSANEYMNTVTSFSASLLQSLGGDTDKAVEYANQAIIDMSDNANKMGTSMESIQFAYQGFAKQNYTMLDNLKLGYGGTKEEMQRLIDDANRVKEANGEMADLTIDSFADVTEAIHIIQTEMGIAGATAQEASTTIEGSANAMKASWKNVLTGIADPTQNLQNLVSNFSTSVKTYLGNLIPVVSNAIKGTAQLFKELAPDILAEIKKQAPKVAEAGKELFSKIVEKAPEAIKNLKSKVKELISNISSVIKSNAPKVLDIGADLFDGLIKGVMNTLPKIIDQVPQIVDAIVNTLNSGIPKVLEVAKRLFASFTDALPDVISSLSSAIPQIISSIVGMIQQNLPKVADAVKEIFSGLVSSLPESLQAALVPLSALAGGILAYNAAVGVAKTVTAAKAAIDAIHTKGLVDATAAQLGLNSAILANPFVWATAAVAALAAGIQIYNANVKKAREEELESIRTKNNLSEAQKQLLDNIKQTSDAYNERRLAQTETNQGIVAESGYVKELWTELQTIVDANGVIKEGYEERAAIIVGVLNEALGTEIEIVNNQVSAYEELAGAIDKVIEKKRTEALVSANQDAYTEAVMGRVQALNNYTSAQEEATKTEANYNQAVAEGTKAFQDLEYVRKQYNVLASKTDLTHEERIQMAELGNEIFELTIKYENASAKIEGTAEAHKTATDTLSSAQQAYAGMNDTIMNYERLLGASVSGDAEAIHEATLKMTNGFINSENATRESLEKQAKTFKSQYNELKKAVESGMPGVTQAQVDEMGELVRLSIKELVKFDNQAKEAGKNGGESYAEGISESENAVVSASNDVSNSANEALGNADTEQTGYEKGEQFSFGIGETELNARQAGATTSEAANNGMATADTSSTGAEKTEEFASGVESGIDSAQSSGENVSNATAEGFGSADTKQKGYEMGEQFCFGIGETEINARAAGASVAESVSSGVGEISLVDIGVNLIQGLIDGMMSKIPGVDGVVQKAKDIVSKIFGGMKEEGDIHSPSRQARDEIGKMIAMGVAIGIDQGSVYITSALDNLVTDTRTEVQKVLDEINEEMLESEKLYAEESIILKESTSDADKEYLEGLKKTAEEERKIHEARKRDVQALKQEIIDDYKDIASEVLDNIEELENAQKDLENKLSVYGELLTPQKTFDSKGNEITKYVLSDFDKQTDALERYRDLLLDVKKRGNVPTEFFQMLRDLDVEEGVKLATALMSATDDEFAAYIQSWERNQQAISNVSKELYADETSALKTEIEKAFGDADEFYFAGTDAATQFGEGFIAQFKTMLSEVYSTLSNAFVDLMPMPDYSYAVSVPTPAVVNGGVLPSFFGDMAMFGSGLIETIGKMLDDKIISSKEGLFGETTIILEVDGREFGRVALDQISQTSQIYGVDLVVK